MIGTRTGRRTGPLVFCSDRSGTDNLWVVNVIDESLTQKTFDETGNYHACWSPDSSTIAFCSHQSGNQDVWSIPVSGGPASRITTNINRDESLDWSRQGARITFDSNRVGDWEIWTIPRTGGSADRVTDSQGFDVEPSGSPGGEWIAFVSYRSGTGDIWTIPSDGGIPEQITNDSALDHLPCWAPDGTALAFASNRTGNWDIWIVSWPGLLTGFRSEAAEMVLNARLATKDTADVSSYLIRRGGRRSVTKQAVPYRQLQPKVGEKFGLSDRELTQVTFDSADDFYPSWSPEGLQIAFSSNRTGNDDVWIVDLPQSAPHAQTDGPAQIRLVETFPNPAQTQAHIAFSVDRPADLSLTVHDVIGHRIATLATGNYARGRHAVVWRGKDGDGRTVSPGTYYVRLLTRDGGDVVPLVLGPAQK